MKKSLVLTSLAAILFATNANAMDSYMSVKTSYSKSMNNIKVKSTDGSSGDVEKEKLEWDDNVAGLRLAYGVKVADVRAELELGLNDKTHHAGTDDETGEAEMDYIYTDTLMLNGYYDIKTNSKWTPYVGAGIGAARIAIPDASLTKGAFAWQLGAGATYSIDQKWALDMGYRYQDNGSFSKTFKDKDDGDKQKFTVDSKQHELMIGARYAF